MNEIQKEISIMDTREYYVINDVVMFTGLTDRTIRNYVAMGVLQGEKVDGQWRFSPEQVENFVCNPAVRPSILAKNNSLVFDFLAESKKQKQEMCLILDVPSEEKMTVATFFCAHITNNGYHNIQFSFDGVTKMARVILKGDAGEVLRLINSYYEEYCTEKK